MKTIRQIAEEIGVSKQAIFYRIKKPPLSYALQSFASKENGVLTISFDGEKLIKQAFFNNDTVKQPSKENALFDDAIVNILCNTVDCLKAQLETKDRQLYEKDKQIIELTATIRIQAGNAKRKPPTKTYKRRASQPKSSAIKRLIKYSK